jgi:hypothetical protein
MYLWLTLGGLALYLAFCLVCYIALGGRRSFQRFFSIWLKE